MINSVITSLLCFFIVLAYPGLKTKSVDQRIISTPMVVSSPPNSPALAAFLDTHLEIDGNNELANQAFQNIEWLESGKLESGKLIKNQPIAIQASDIHITQVEPILPNLYADEGRLLPLKERLQKLENYYVNNSNVDLSNDSWTEKAKELLANEKYKDISRQKKKIIAASSGPIIIEKPMEISKKEGYLVEPKNNPPTPQPQSDKEPSGSVEVLASRQTEFSYNISGEVELGQGLAFAGSEASLNIFREFDGEVVDEGRIWIEQGRYEIFVNELTGYLLLELVNREGELLGLAEVDLNTFENLPYANNKIEGLHLFVEPVKKGIQFELHAPSYPGHTLHVDDASAHIVDLGRKLIHTKNHIYKDNEIEKGSSIWVSVDKKKHWSTTAPLLTYGKSAVKLFPERDLETMATSLGFDLDSKKGWIFGKLKNKKGPLAGAKVEVAGLNKNHSALYFSAATELVEWPDKSLELSTKNGLFVVPNLEEGLYAIRVTLNKTVFPAEIIYVDAKSVTYMDLSYREMRSASVHVQDRIFNVNHLGATIKVSGSDDEMQFFGSKKDSIRYPAGYGTMTYEVDPGSDYLLTKTKFSRDVRALRLPAIPEKWFRESLIKEGLEQNPELGAVVGFIEGDDYDVMIADQSGEAEHYIVYFDPNGNVVEDGYGVAGGGFIVTNLPEGMTSVAVIPHNKKSILMKSLIAEQGYANTFNSSF